jgi:very-short-patch-repair endonuclease
MKEKLRTRANMLRKNSTDAERHLWLFLKSRRLCHYKFRRQYVITPYIVDFVCLWKRLIVELDGSQHALKHAYDQERTSFLESKGFRVIRFWNDAVIKERENVIETILAVLED